jgi:hypothetical protein
MRLLLLLILAIRPALAQEVEVKAQPAPDHLATIADTYLAINHPIVWSPGLTWYLEPPPEPRDTWSLWFEDKVRAHAGMIVLSIRRQAVVATDIRIVASFPPVYEPIPIYEEPFSFPPTPELLAIAEEAARTLRGFETDNREWVVYDGADLLADQRFYHRSSTFDAVTADTWVLRQQWTIPALDGLHAMVVIAKSDKRVIKVGFNWLEVEDVP